MTNHEPIKIILGLSLTLLIGFVFYKYKVVIASGFGAENYYLLLSYSAVIPPFILNKSYDLIVRKSQDRSQRKIALSIDDNDEALQDEALDFKLLIKSKKSGVKGKIERFKEIELSKKTL